MRLGPCLEALLAACSLLAVAGEAAARQQYDVPEILKTYYPVRPWVEVDTPTDPEEIKACKVEVVARTATVDGKATKVGVGIVIRDGQGRILRRFLDMAEPKGKTDQWSYYQDGFEVYREVDYNGDQKIDEIRWLNQQGTRIAVMQGGRVQSWRRLSAEEASKVLVQALVDGDLELLNSVMATPEELRELGLPDGLVAQVTADRADRRARVEALLTTLRATGWNREATWQRFDGVQPHVIPADAANGIKDDILLYENAAAFAWPPDGQVDLNKVAYLQIPELVRIGDAWKFVTLPRAFDPSKPEVLAAADGVRSWVYREAGPVVGEGATPEHQQALTALAELDQKWMPQLESIEPKAVANYHYQRVQLLRKVVETAAADDRLEYEKEIVNSLAAAYQSGEFPAGLEALQKLIDAGGPLASYAAFRKIPAEYTLRSRDPDRIGEAQKAWVADLESYLVKYPKAAEVPEVLFQLANMQELNGDEAAARASYERITRDFAQSEPAGKAAGALRRLGLVGQVLELRGTAPDGKTVDLAAERGKMVLVVFGASVADAFNRELTDLARLHERYRDRGFQIVAVALDPDKAAWDDFVARKQIPWPTIFEPGGMDSRLADEFGIISYFYPTMILVDQEGKVLDRDLRTALEVERAIEKPLAQKP